MGTRASIVITALALVLAACGGGDATQNDEPTTTSTSTTIATTTTTEPLGDVVLRYGYRPETRVTYDLDLTADVEASIDGDAAALAEEGLPSAADLRTSVETVVGFDVYDGPEPDTFELAVTAVLTGGEVSGTVDGEPFDPAMHGATADQLASIPSIEKNVIIRTDGEILSISGSDGMAAAMGDLSSLGSLGGDHLGEPLGPVFPEEAVGVGDSWTTSRTIDGPGGPVTVQTVSEIVAVEPYEDVEVFVIESTTTTEGFEIDFTEMVRSMFEGFSGIAGDDADAVTGDVPPEMQEMLDRLTFVISVAPNTSETTVWFDPEAGLVRRAEERSDGSVTMEFAGPDEDTAELVSVRVELRLGQSAVFELTGIEPLAG